MPRARETTDSQEEWIQRLALEGLSGAEIHRRLKAEGLLDDPNPTISLRLVQDRKAKLSPSDSSGAWSLTSAAAEDARLVGDVFAYIVDQSGFRVWLTRDVAAQVIRVRATAPDVPAPWAYSIAYALWFRVAKAVRDEGIPPEPLDLRYVDLVLSARPWVSPERAEWCLALLNRLEAMEGARDSWRDLWSRLHLLSDTSDGMLGCFGNPWPAISTPVSTPEPLDSGGHP